MLAARGSARHSIQGRGEKRNDRRGTTKGEERKTRNGSPLEGRGEEQKRENKNSRKCVLVLAMARLVGRAFAGDLRSLI
jgi:hypothetical protein